MLVQFGGMVTDSVGVSVISGARVIVGGMYPALVGARVAVTKSDGTGVSASSTSTEIQDESRTANRSIKIIFFMFMKFVG